MPRHVRWAPLPGATAPATGRSTIGGAKAPPQPGLGLLAVIRRATDAKASYHLSAKTRHHDDGSHEHAPEPIKEPACFTFTAVPKRPKRPPLLPTVGAGGAVAAAGSNMVNPEATPINYLTLPPPNQSYVLPGQHDFIQDLLKCWNELLAPRYRQGYALPTETDIQAVYSMLQNRLHEYYVIFEAVLQKEGGGIWDSSAFNLLTAMHDVTDFAQGKLNFRNNSLNTQQRGTREWSKYTNEWKEQITSLQQSRSHYQSPELLKVDTSKLHALQAAILTAEGPSDSAQGRPFTVNNLLAANIKNQCIRYSYFMYQGEMYGTPPYGEIVSSIAALLNLRRVDGVMPQPSFHSKIVKAMAGSIEEFKTKASARREDCAGGGPPVKRARTGSNRSNGSGNSGSRPATAPAAPRAVQPSASASTSLMPSAPDATGRPLHYGKSIESVAVDDSFLQAALHELSKIYDRHQMRDAAAHEIVLHATQELSTHLSTIPVGTAYIDSTIVMAHCPEESRPLVRAFAIEHARNANNLDQIRLTLAQYLKCLMEYHRQLALQYDQDQQSILRLRREMDNPRRHDDHDPRARSRPSARERDEERYAEERRFNAEVQDRLAQMRLQEVAPLQRELEQREGDCHQWSVHVAELTRKHQAQVESLSKEVTSGLEKHFRLEKLNLDLTKTNEALRQINLELQQASQSDHQTGLPSQHPGQNSLAMGTPTGLAIEMTDPHAHGEAAQMLVEPEVNPTSMVVEAPIDQARVMHGTSD